MAGQRTAKISSITWIGLTLNTWYTLAEAFAPLLGPTGEILLPYSMSPNGLAADLTWVYESMSIPCRTSSWPMTKTFEMEGGTTVTQGVTVAALKDLMQRQVLAPAHNGRRHFILLPADLVKTCK